MSKSYFQLLNYNLLFYKCFSFSPNSQKVHKDSISAKKQKTFPTNQPAFLDI